MTQMDVFDSFDLDVGIFSSADGVNDLLFSAR